MAAAFQAELSLENFKKRISIGKNGLVETQPERTSIADDFDQRVEKLILLNKDQFLEIQKGIAKEEDAEEEEVYGLDNKSDELDAHIPASSAEVDHASIQGDASSSSSEGKHTESNSSEYFDAVTGMSAQEDVEAEAKQLEVIQNLIFSVLNEQASKEQEEEEEEELESENEETVTPTNLKEKGKEKEGQKLTNFLNSIKNSERKPDNEGIPSPALCPICLDEMSPESKYRLQCGHEMCKDCLVHYFSMCINEGRTNPLCPESKCQKEVSPVDLRVLLPNDLFGKFTKFALKRYLKITPNCHVCPSPNCEYAVIIEPKKKFFGLMETKCEGSKSEITCGNPKCNTKFCYHCGEVAHPSMSCQEKKVMLHSLGSQGTDNVKPCPKCGVAIYKLEDGSCNHMKCSVCQTEFCWLCLKEVNDIHFFSPSGCTFYATKPWSAKKKVVGRTVFAVAAPIGIGLIAAAAVPAIMIAFPVSIGKKIHRGYKHNKTKRIAYYCLGIPGAVLASPFLAGLTVGIGVPLLLIGTYVFVPAYLINEHVKNQKILAAKAKAFENRQLEMAGPPTEELAS